MVATMILSVAPVSAEENTTTQDIKKDSKVALQKVYAGLKKVKKAAYVDMTGDGVKDLFVNGVVYTYNAKTKAVIKVKLKYSDTTPLKKFKKMYISKKKKRIYFVSSDKKVYGSGMYKKYYRGWIYKMKDIREPSEEEGTMVTYDSKYVAKIKKPKNFVPKRKYRKKASYYMIDTSWDDQDDAWYNYYTTKKLNKKLKKLLPGKKKIKLKNKLTIKVKRSVFNTPFYMKTCIDTKIPICYNFTRYIKALNVHSRCDFSLQRGSSRLENF